MRYLIFKKRNDLSDKPDWYDPVITKYIYSTTEFDLAQIKYEDLESKLSVTEVLFLVADFGNCLETKIFQITYIDLSKNYLPFFVIRCSNDAYFNYNEKFFMKQEPKVVIIQNGIHQSFFDAVKAFDKYDYYRKYRIDANMAIEYIDMNDKTYVIPVSSIRNILFHKNENYIQRLGFEEIPGYHRFGPFWVKDKNLKEQVEA